jgi:hypothetical protein
MDECGIKKMELLRKQHYCRKFYNEINMARKQFKPGVHICRNEDGSLIGNELNRQVRHSDKLLKSKEG